MSKAAKAVVGKSGSPTGWWLMKSEPHEFSVSQLEEVSKKKNGGGTEPWTGCRNYQVRNFMRSMSVGDRFFFYHSNTDVPGVVGVGKVAKAAYPDPTQFDKASKYYDAASKKEDPRWSCVDVAFVEKFAKTVTLEQLKKSLSGETDCAVAAKGNRLSAMPVLTAKAVETILQLAGSKHTAAAGGAAGSRRERKDDDDDEEESD